MFSIFDNSFLIEAMSGILASDNSFLIDALEKGGLPAFVIAVFFLIFFFWIRSVQKNTTIREASQAEERSLSTERDAEQYNALMHAYEEMVGQFIILSRDSTKAITRLSERVSQCPLRDVQPRTVRGDE